MNEIEKWEKIDRVADPERASPATPRDWPTTPHVARHPNGHLMIEQVPVRMPTPNEVDDLIASLAKAHPYLVAHADHIDGEFANALDALRKDIAWLRVHIRLRDERIAELEAAAASSAQRGGAETGRLLAALEEIGQMARKDGPYHGGETYHALSERMRKVAIDAARSDA